MYHNSCVFYTQTYVVSTWNRNKVRLTGSAIIVYYFRASGKTRMLLLTGGRVH